MRNFVEQCEQMEIDPAAHDSVEQWTNQTLSNYDDNRKAMRENGWA